MQSFVIGVGLLWIDFGSVYIKQELHLIHFCFVKDYMVL